MAPNNKNMKTQQQEEEKRDLDRLSTLGDDILGHVLSFLDTKSAAKTSVLSKRYRHAWTLSECLDFKLLSPDTGCDLSHASRSFESNVIRVLQQRKPCTLRSFRLSLHLPVSSAFIDKCTDHAARHGVQHLRLRVYTNIKLPGTIKLPELLLTSRSLVTLRLNNALPNAIELPEHVLMPNLKSLRLKNFIFPEKAEDGEVSQKAVDDKMFSGCPNLENLVLIKCSMKPIEIDPMDLNDCRILDFECLNLKSLEIRNWRNPWRCFEEQVIVVNAPRLVFFRFEGYLAIVGFKNAMPSLKEAYIDLSYPTNCSSDRMSRTSHSLLSLLDEISNAKFLSMLSKTFEVLSDDDPKWYEPKLKLFENLEIVEVRAEKQKENLKKLFWPPNF